ncbi:hypothetical protein HDV02_002579 [Globomyces sp. JEL0801]|nr:hypothetical protein HDV02_002579 [Globomyces sp. JEL0801]
MKFTIFLLLGSLIAAPVDDYKIARQKQNPANPPPNTNGEIDIEWEGRQKQRPANPPPTN